MKLSFIIVGAHLLFDGAVCVAAYFLSLKVLGFTQDGAWICALLFFIISAFAAGILHIEFKEKQK